MAVLAQLRSEHYGYTLKRELADQGLDIDEGRSTPLLRRLESQRLLVSEWREEDKLHQHLGEPHRRFPLSGIKEQDMDLLDGYVL